MAHLKFRGVNDGFNGLVKLFADSQHFYDEIEIIKTGSRNGPVLQIVEPVIISFSNPTERVLFNTARDCNPFFHIYEALWMLSGRNDVAPLAYYAPNMVNYSDDGETLNGAYGYRWRHANAAETPGKWADVDQLKLIINHLKAKPDSRRVILQMWNVEDDLLKIGPSNQSKDVCCNVCVMFSLREETHTQDYDRGDGVFVEASQFCKVLDMTVINRSNDLVWGMLGANYVHFSFLQEYMAACIGVEVGVYNQMSNNLHIYTENNSGFKHEAWLSDDEPDHYTTDFKNRDHIELMRRVPLVRDPATFDLECPRFVEAIHKHSSHYHVNWSEPFLQRVATPMLWAFELHKRRDYDSALNCIKEVAADDWRIAGTSWLQKRKLNWEKKQAE
jgi:thymidylate synthase